MRTLVTIALVVLIVWVGLLIGLAAWTAVTAVAALLVFAMVVVGLYVLMTRGTRAVFGPRRRLEAELGLEVLERRLARGEISPAEFEQAKHALGL